MPAAILLMTADLAAFVATVAAVWLLAPAGMPAQRLIGGAYDAVVLLPLAVAMAYLLLRGRAARRWPLRPLLVAGMLGAVASLLVGLALDQQALAAELLVAWLIFPLTAFGLRVALTASTVGSPAARLQLREARRLLLDLASRLLPVDPRMMATGAAPAAATRPASHDLSRGASVLARIGTLPPLATPPSGYVAGGSLPDLALERASLGRAAKVGFDMVAAAAALVALAPVLLVLAVLVRRDGGPVLYAHTRIGRQGRRFPCLKFRSMVMDSDAVLQRVLAADPAAAAEWAETQKLKDDPRVTRVGRILRKTSLDELPQLLNVLRGEMSLVGPRPIVANEVPRYGENIAYYLAARPGITGLWQVSGRSETSYAERVALDTAYVKDWGFWKDVGIVLRTVPAVLKRKGAV